MREHRSRQVIEAPEEINAALRERLQAAGIRPTFQRLELARLLFRSEEGCHLSARQLHELARGEGLRISLATVYNTLGRFVDAGLLQAISTQSDELLFDTNTRPHAHIVCSESGRLWDAELLELIRLDALIPEEFELEDVELTIRVRPRRGTSSSQGSGEP